MNFEIAVLVLSLPIDMPVVSITTGVSLAVLSVIGPIAGMSGDALAAALEQKLEPWTWLTAQC